MIPDHSNNFRLYWQSCILDPFLVNISRIMQCAYYYREVCRTIYIILPRRTTHDNSYSSITNDHISQLGRDASVYCYAITGVEYG